MTKKVNFERILIFAVRAHLALALILSQSTPACAATEITPEPTLNEYPLARGPGVSQEQIEALAEAEGRLSLADQLDLNRPEKSDQTRLHNLVERAQVSWLSGSIDVARGFFKEIAHLALEADWREPQREAIHYAILRLAQSAATGTEKGDWLEKAVVTFPDLLPDGDAFPPPLVLSYQATRTRLLSIAPMFSPAAHFPDTRFLIINGRKYVLTPDLRIKLPQATYRVTALSDSHPPVTERLSSSQLREFQLSVQPLASGTCDAPAVIEGSRLANHLAVVYSADCIRVKSPQGWLPKALSDSEQNQVIDQSIQNPAFEASIHQNQLLNSMNTEPPSEKKSSISKKSWILIGATVLALGAAYAISQSMNRSSSTSSSPAANPPIIPTVPTAAPSGGGGSSGPSAGQSSGPQPGPIQPVRHEGF